MAITTKLGILLLFLISLQALPSAFCRQVNGKSFDIDYVNNTFLKDGKPFQYVSGSIHYTRIHSDYWEDRLKKIRAAGLNAIQTIVPWNAHELSPGQFSWEGIADLPRFLSLAQKSDLVVLLRIGPYICAEWEFGGFPAWLLTENSDMVLRSSDPAYMKWVEKWFNVLLQKINPFLYENGGPVVMVQIENEYGSYFTCDHVYTLALRDMVQKQLGYKILIYTTDGSNLVDVTCGKVNQTYSTVDFGVSCKPENCFAVQRFIEPKGPLVNSEFYTGWLDHWGSNHSVLDTEPIIKNLDIILGMGASVNMYMFIGGTNFGYTNGANYPPYQAVPTSYDYDGPLTEAGDYHEKYLAIRDVVTKYLPKPTEPLPPHTNKTAYGKVSMKFVTTLQDALHVLTPEGPYLSKYPVNMEKLRFYDAFILYRFTLLRSYLSPTVLASPGVRDRAIVMVDGIPFGIMDREGRNSVNITGSKGQVVDILVENQGRIGFGSQMNFNLKGLTDNVTIANRVVYDWQIFPLHLENMNAFVISQLRSKERTGAMLSVDGSLSTPSFYEGSFTIPQSPYQPQDTFLDPGQFTKGQAFVNGFNLGRYWPMRGPQVTLYVPKPVLNTDPIGNHLLLFELENSSSCIGSTSAACVVNFTDTANINSTIHPDLNGLALEGYTAEELNVGRVH